MKLLSKRSNLTLLRKKDHGENDCWNVYIDPNKEEETQKQMKEHNTNTSRSVDQETPSNPNTLSDEQSEKTDQEINKNIEPINKLKVLILSNETISNKLPLFPRYIYWNDSGELNEIIFTLMRVNPFKCFKYKENSNNEELLFIIISFIMNKQIILTETTGINDFLLTKTIPNIF